MWLLKIHVAEKLMSCWYSQLFVIGINIDFLPLCTVARSFERFGLFDFESLWLNE